MSKKNLDNEVLFRTSEYIATGYFHNSQITAVDHVKKTVTFKYKSWPLLAIHVRQVSRGTRKKSFKTRTTDLYSYMGRMLFFLPGKNRKMIRCYGIYAHKLDEKIKKIEIRTLAKAIENSFQKIRKSAPNMIKDTVYSFRADNAMKMLIKNHTIIGGVEANLHVLCGFDIRASVPVIF
ncbi:MAG: hypothetical protein CVV49_16865 [Spirochaetae bacterium HGW-Spirochaetae-5]|nr:MAG: hypothetical protein CVV49_16865 [Spirochaetae bacterium HGW-Spirochaetae-5]